MLVLPDGTERALTTKEMKILHQAEAVVPSGSNMWKLAEGIEPKDIDTLLATDEEE